MRPTGYQELELTPADRVAFTLAFEQTGSLRAEE